MSARLTRVIMITGTDVRCANGGKKIGWSATEATNTITVSAFVHFEFLENNEWRAGTLCLNPLTPGQNFTQAQIDAYTSAWEQANEPIAKPHESSFDTKKTIAGAISHVATPWDSTGNGDDNIITIDFDDEDEDGVNITVSGCRPGSPGDYEQTYLADFEVDHFTSDPNICP